MIFPIGDDQVKGGYPAIISYSFIAINIVIFLIQIQFPDLLVCSYGAIPAELVQGEDLTTILSSMFMHGGWMHLIGNMLFLWVFADNIEATVGSQRFVLFYFLGGIAAVLAHVLLGTTPGAGTCCSPCGLGGIPCNGSLSACSALTPMVGASGAISAVMGAYLVMFPSSRVRLLFLIFPFRIPAFLFLGIWIWQQWGSGMASLSAVGGTSEGVAWWAHIGGFAFGLIAGIYFRSFRKKHDYYYRG
ncbi:MAG: rhomboid family intramembrane serine protease [Bacteroidota bacterium]